MTVPELDTSLLSGFRFRCRSDCGLCCFASPSVAPGERAALLQIQPRIELIDEGAGYARIPEQGAGGACRLLEDLRCAGHSARPFPCRTFPLHVYLGARAQLTVVLSCPGVDSEGWLRGANGDSDPPTPTGLEAELAAVEERWASPEARDRWTRARRSQERLLRRAVKLDGYSAVGDARRELGRHLSDLVAERIRPPPSPLEAEGLDALPLFWEAGRGIVAMADSPTGTELIRLGPGGGVVTRFGTYSADFEPSGLTPSGRAAIDRYLELVIARDLITDAVLRDWVADPGRKRFVDALRAELETTGATVLARGALRARAAGRGGGVLDEADVLSGIRATDAELLDRPIVGELL